jgi:hypothetical protein
MSKYWGVGEEDDYIPPTSADYIPPMRFEPKQAKIKSDTEYNGRPGCRDSQRNRGRTSITKKIGGVCISVHAKSTGTCIRILRKCNLNRFK